MRKVWILHVIFGEWIVRRFRSRLSFHEPHFFSEVDRKPGWVAGAACGLDGLAVVGHGPVCFVS